MELLVASEARVLGCLIEKELTTPEYYPLTLNALTHACNQKSNRSPVVSLDDRTVLRAVDGLRDKKLSWLKTTAAGRVPKYGHALAERLGLGREELAVLCELLVRGPQTVGELRGRASRMTPFADRAMVETVLTRLMERGEGPLVVRLPRQSGRKECRYAHTFEGVPEPPADGEQTAFAPEPARLAVTAETERLNALEEEVRSLREEVAELRERFERFRSEFE
ncbi:MAG: DUF480 domain-containing protein [Kiritimatiellaeota bacterium]|nr:DUF480 domain-containing protein [Kiritimatiellota bacterium]